MAQVGTRFSTGFHILVPWMRLSCDLRIHTELNSNCLKVHSATTGGLRLPPLNAADFIVVRLLITGERTAVQGVHWFLRTAEESGIEVGTAKPS